MTAGDVQNKKSLDFFIKKIGKQNTDFIIKNNKVIDFDLDDEYNEYHINIDGESITTNGKKWWTCMSLGVYGIRFDSFEQLVQFSKSPKYLNDIKSINREPIKLK